MSDAATPPPFDPSKPFTVGRAAPPPFDPSKPFTTAKPAAAPEQSTGLTGIIESVMGHLPNLAKMVGMKPALEDATAIQSARPPYRPGQKLGEAMGFSPAPGETPEAMQQRRTASLTNPMLYAMGPGNIGQSLAPRMAAPQAALAQKGVQMTPGQAVGGIAKGAEDLATSFPILGHWINNAKERSIQSFNEATINQALEPIGRRLPKTVQPGYDAIKKMGDMLSSAYDHVLNRIPSVARDPELGNDISAVRAEAMLNPYVRDRILPFIHDKIDMQFSNSGRLQGSDVKSIISNLKEQARGYGRGSQDERNLALLQNDLAGVLQDAIERQYPAEAQHLQAIDKGYAMATRIEQAAGQRATSGGTFMPSELLQASRAQAPGVRRGGVARQFSHGDAIFQKWGLQGQRVLPSKVPDSGTASRTIAKDIVGAGIGLGLGQFSPALAAGYAGAIGGGGIPYIPPVSRFIQGQMERPRSIQALPSRAGIAITAPGAMRKQEEKKKRELRASVGG